MTQNSSIINKKYNIKNNGNKLLKNKIITNNEKITK